MSALRRQRQVDLWEFEAHQGYMVKLCLKEAKQTKTRTERTGVYRVRRRHRGSREMRDSKTS